MSKCKYSVGFDELKRVIVTHGPHTTHLKETPLVYYSGELANGSFAVWAGDHSGPKAIHVFHHTREHPVASSMAIAHKKHSFEIKGNDIHFSIGRLKFRF